MNIGRAIFLLGLFLAGVGLLVMAAERFSFFHLGRLPGDIVYRRKNFTFYLPLATSLLLSALLTLLFWVFRRR